MPAAVHPHVFAEAKLDVALTPDGQAIQSLKHHWLFDDVFSPPSSSSSTRMATTSWMMRNSRKSQRLSSVDRRICLFPDRYAERQGCRDEAAGDLAASFQGNQLIIQFHSEPAQPFKLAGKIEIGIYDPTFYTAIEYLDDKDLVVAALPPGCGSKGSTAGPR
jgi:ABC-type uncharacterized transport system substrate-binding protein